jgi:NAD(P)H-hydrate repair Nnr-like enzyme with NAD(P)H-hydrate epimerase domain
MPKMQDIPKKRQLHQHWNNNADIKEEKMIHHKQVMLVSQYIGNVVLEDVTNQDIECIIDSLEGMSIAGLIDMEFIKEIHGE